MNDSNDNQKRLKEELIKEEIINKNYDKDLFFQYISEKKENGSDLNNWSILELNLQISNFINLKSNDSQQTNNINEEENNKAKISLTETLNINKETQSNIHQQIQSQVQNINIYNNNQNSRNKVYAKEIICKKLEKTPLNDTEIIVKIKNPKISDNKYWEQKYINYEIVTDKMKWLVYRRFSDFDNLRQILVKHFPRLFVPPIPGKKLGKRRFENDFIQKRMNFLQIFIDNIMKNEVFKTCEALYAFLSFEDRSQYESKIKEMLSYNPSQYVEDCKTLTGKLCIYDKDDYEQYYTNITNYYKIQNNIYYQLNRNMKNFYINISGACKSLEAVQKDFETLFELNQRVEMKVEVNKTFEELAIFFKNWKRNLFNQNEIIKLRITDFFKYQRMEGEAYQELIYKREELKANYNSEKVRINSKKEKLYALRDINKWEIQRGYNPIDEMRLLNDKEYAMEFICTKETLSLENLHKQFAYSNKMNMEELTKLINLNCKKFVDNTKSFAEEFYPTLTDSISVWTTLTSYI